MRALLLAKGLLLVLFWATVAAGGVLALGFLFVFLGGFPPPEALPGDWDFWGFVSALIVLAFIFGGIVGLLEMTDSAIRRAERSDRE